MASPRALARKPGGVKSSSSWINTSALDCTAASCDASSAPGTKSHVRRACVKGILCALRASGLASTFGLDRLARYGRSGSQEQVGQERRAGLDRVLREVRHTGLAQCVVVD